MARPYEPHQVFTFIKRGVETEETRKTTTEIRENLNRDIEVFLANGGKIVQIPGYEVSEQDDRFRIAQTGINSLGLAI